MADQETKTVNRLNLLIDTFWALLPEKTASEVAGMKKLALLAVRDTFSWVVDKEIEWTEKHLENARKMRERYEESSSPAAEATVADVPR